MSQGLVERQYLEDIGDAIRSKVGGSSTYTPSQMASAIAGIHTADEVVLVQKTVNANGQYNASDDSADGYSGVMVNVPNTYGSGDEGKVVSDGALVSQSGMSVVSNGTYDTTLFSQVSVAIPEAVLMSKVISENGTYNATDYGADGFSHVTVNVAGGGGGLPDFILTGESGVLVDTSVAELRDYAFISHSNISGVSMGGVSIIGGSAFAHCPNIRYADFQNCVSVMKYAFYNCPKLNTINLPECKYISDQVFYHCNILSNVLLPKCESIGDQCFAQCSNIKMIEFSEIQNIGSSAFVSCSKLSNINIPKCKTIYPNGFGYCDLREISLPECKNLRNNVFYNNKQLSKATFLVLETIGSAAFMNCSKLEELIILTSSVCRLYPSVFYNTPMVTSSIIGRFGSIYVPASLVEEYKIASNWSAISERITAYNEE